MRLYVPDEPFWNKTFTLADLELVVSDLEHSPPHGASGSHPDWAEPNTGDGPFEPWHFEWCAFMGPAGGYGHGA